MKRYMPFSLTAAAIFLLLALTVVPAWTAAFTVTSTAATGAGSLEAAIIASNAAGPGPNTISFNIAGAGQHTISPTVANPLPAITIPVTINGYTQPGSSVNTAVNTDNAVLNIVIDGSLAGPTGAGLVVQTSGCTITGLQIWGFLYFDVEIDNDANTVAGCFLGTDGTTGVVAPLSFGVYISNCSDNIIGGIALADRNIISGTNTGIYISGSSATGNSVLGNFIGIQMDGATALPNDYGVYVNNASSTIIGGSAIHAGNVISGNTFDNVHIGPTAIATDNVVKGNHIGTNAAGTAAVPTAAGPVYTAIGIEVNAAVDTYIGGLTAADGNLISGNVTGIALDNGATGTEIENNLIGTDVTGLLSIPNTADGVSALSGAVDNTIGPANTIANSGADGVGVDGAATLGNQITRNSIFTNTGLGISLTNGGNLELPAPVLTSASVGGGGTTVVGTLTVVSQPSTVFILEFFTDPVNEAGGKVYIGSKAVTTDGSGVASFTAFFPALFVAHGQYITATATDPANDTSPFSNAVQVPLVSRLVITKSALPTTVPSGANLIYYVKVRNAGSDSAAAVTITDPVPAALTVGSLYTTIGSISAVGNLVTATIGTLDPGKSATIAIYATVSPTQADGSLLTNTATVTSTTGPSSNSVTVVTQVTNKTSPRLVVSASLVSGNPIPAPNTTQTYVFTIKLKANQTCYGITITGTALGLTVKPTISTGTVKYAGPIIWTIPSLNAGQTATLTATVRRTIPYNAVDGSLFQITGPWTGSYYSAASQMTTIPTQAINVVVTKP